MVGIRKGTMKIAIKIKQFVNNHACLINELCHYFKCKDYLILMGESHPKTSVLE